MSITSGQLAELKKLAKEADGVSSDEWCSWKVGGPEEEQDSVWDQSDSSAGMVCTIAGNRPYLADYIAAANPQTILALIAEIERLRAITGERD